MLSTLPAVFLVVLISCFISASAFVPTVHHLQSADIFKLGVSSDSLGDAIVEPQAGSDHDILIRAAKGEKTERPPVWLMRQAGRYMADFRAFSDKYPFRYRSETPDVAIELSLQPWRSFGVDGVIMFSDILTPLPAMGIEFDVVKGKGPIITNPIRSVEAAKAVKMFEDPEKQIPFIRTILTSLRSETEGKTSLLGFVGAPWTLAAYAIEGGSSKNCLHTKMMMMQEPEVFHELMLTIAQNIADYACYQIESGAQFIQIFESWAHQLSPSQFITVGRPYAELICKIVKERHPGVPVIYFANGGSTFLELQKPMQNCGLCIDWRCTMERARKVFGPNRVLSGNVDPMVLLGGQEDIEEAVLDCLEGNNGGPLVFNVGHGVVQQTPEEAVKYFVDFVKQQKLAV